LFTFHNLITSFFCSILLLSITHKKALSHEDSAFLSLKFEVESLMWMEQNLKAIASNIIHQTSNIKEKETSHDGRNRHTRVPLLSHGG